MRKLTYNFVSPLRAAYGESMPTILLLMRDNLAFLKAVLEKDVGSMPPLKDWWEAGMQNISQNPLDWAVLGRDEKF